MSYQHKEAFALMKYASDEGEIVEWIWNSRDGVTPFVTMSRDGDKELTHVDWQLDRYLPNYVPLPGERVFVDMTPEIAEEKASAYVERWWEQLQEEHASREEAVQAFVSAWTREPGLPTVVLAGNVPELIKQQQDRRALTMALRQRNPRFA